MIRNILIDIKSFFRRKYRSWYYTTPPSVLPFQEYRDGKLSRVDGYPMGVCGLMVAVSTDAGRRLIGYHSCLDKDGFLRAWYALGGVAARLETGERVDPSGY